MGGGPTPEHMVIVLWGPEPTSRIREIKSRFPYIEITYLDLGDHKHPQPGGTKPTDLISPELYQKATIWVTLSILPPNPDVVPNLKLLHLFSAGVDHWAGHPIFDDDDGKEKAKERITITTSSGVSSVPIAEWVVMTSLVVTKRFGVTYEWQRGKEWGGNEDHLREGRDWVGRTVGVLGYGSIGRQVARLFTALGSRVLAYTASSRRTAASRADTGYIVPGTGDPSGIFPAAWYSGTTKDDLHNFLRQGIDLLVVCLPLTPATEKLIGKEEFEILSSACRGRAEPNSPEARQGPSAQGPYVANISRGKILDQAALVEALNGGVLGGAMLDVADPEPLPKEDPLWTAKNVVITPHVSGLGVEYTGRAYDVLVGNLARREKGEELWNVVRRGRGY